MDARDRDMSIVRQLKDINQESGAFGAGVLSDDLSKDDQIDFAIQLVGLAIAIKQRAEGTAGMAIEGNVTDDGRTSGGRKLPPGDV